MLMVRFAGVVWLLKDAETQVALSGTSVKVVGVSLNKLYTAGAGVAPPI